MDLVSQIKPLVEKKILKEWEKNGFIEPKVYFMNGTNKTFITVGDYMKNDASKARLNEKIKNLVKQHHYTETAFVTEMWLAQYSSKDKSKTTDELYDEAVKDYGPKASKHPGRIDGIMLLIWSKDFKGMKAWEVKDKKIIEIDDYDFIDPITPENKDDERGIFQNPYH